ncbi:MAG: putative DNA primase/helicase [Planctomycetota bacterium]|jgi:putative DNA primase/helicase
MTRTPPIDDYILINDDEIINQLATMTMLEYERVRVAQAKEMGFRPTVLDELVKTARNGDTEASDLPFKVVEPFPTPVDPALLLNEISEAIRRFIVMEPEQADAAALWVALTWFIDVVEVAPLAMINAPEKACGKSQLLDVLGRMSARPLPVANTTIAGLFRSVELWRPTVLIDEADTFLRDNAELKGLINAGHTRAYAFVLRVVGDNHEPKMFKVWGAKALAGISLEKHLPDSTMSRAIVFNLRRKLPHESVTRLRHANARVFEDIASKLARFADDHSQQVQLARPELPDELSDRAQDNWEPLLAIAQCAGSEWELRANAAAVKLSGANEEKVSTGNELLADIQQVFIAKGSDKIKTVDLISALENDAEKPWATYNRGKPITPRQLAKFLSGYGIKSKTVRFEKATPKGYEAIQFTDAFARYLGDSENLPKQRNVSAKPLTGMKKNVSDADNVAATPTTEETPQAHTSLGGCGVADNSGAGGGAGDADSSTEGADDALF